MELGYSLICEEHPPEALVDNAVRAEAAGFQALAVSDHFHPWLEEQGHSPFAWTVMGALTARTSLPLTSLVTCPIKRYHPAIVAQMAATTARMAPAGLTLGLGTGENLNEHIVGGGWLDPVVRQDMLEEAVVIIRDLLSGAEVTAIGDWFTVDRARLYTLPDDEVPIGIASSGPSSAQLAAELDAALITVGPQSDLIDTYREAGGAGPVIAQASVCWHEDEAEARRTVHERWRQGVLGWDANAELPTPDGFATASQTVREEDAVGSKPVGADVDAYVESLGQFRDAGVDLVFVHDIGPRQGDFLAWAESELLPAVRST